MKNPELYACAFIMIVIGVLTLLAGCAPPSAPAEDDMRQFARLDRV